MSSHSYCEKAIVILWALLSLKSEPLRCLLHLSGRPVYFYCCAEKRLRSLIWLPKFPTSALVRVVQKKGSSALRSRGWRPNHYRQLHRLDGGWWALVSTDHSTIQETGFPVTTLVTDISITVNQLSYETSEVVGQDRVQHHGSVPIWLSPKTRLAVSWAWFTGQHFHSITITITTILVNSFLKAITAHFWPLSLVRTIKTHQKGYNQ